MILLCLAVKIYYIMCIVWVEVESWGIIWWVGMTLGGWRSVGQIGLATIIDI